ncbi:hypothetical protein HETIRDRAFT_318918, partial [Heterobasidion irregulare TC 32-1]
RPVIPKRGEKDFEPAPGGASGLQLHNLDRARDAMLAALRSTRATSSKSISHATWDPALARAHVTLARGIHFSSMGHSVARPTASASSDSLRPQPHTHTHTRTQTQLQKRPPKRLELLPEEALYLVEKGALLCSKPADVDADDDGGGGGGGVHAPPMSVQQAFAEMLGRDGLSLEKYQVFSYLRRLGYVVTRARAPSPAYPVPAPYPPPYPASNSASNEAAAVAESTVLSVVRRIFTALFAPFAGLARVVGFVDAGAASIFRALRFIPAGHKAPLHHSVKAPESEPDPDPYEVFFHLYKPATPFRKTAPPPPDFELVVVNARTTPMPTLAQLAELYRSLPEIPPPLPRQRRPPPAPAPAPSTSTPAPPSSSSLPQPPPAPTPPTPTPHKNPASSLLTRLLPRLPFSRAPVPGPSSGPSSEPTKRTQSRAPPRVNPFMALRQGTRTVVIAAVDAGVVSFFRLGEGAFEAWPMVG